MNQLGFLLPPQTTCTVYYINLTHIVKALETSKPNNSMRPAMFIVERTPFSPASSTFFFSSFRQEGAHQSRACIAYRLTFLQHCALWSRWRLTSGRTICLQASIFFIRSAQLTQGRNANLPEVCCECVGWPISKDMATWCWKCLQTNRS